ncbi:hypothetical protein NQ318_005304 [Aromia moschata]|uniref:MADF domain-containing protein n=1 Tax=Aromia moschata TaxID=1265417 RepID=A0AAV8XTV9_9CUCU|nr:hypothetical protein NQ318_005304 [Aromia moschata]
MDHRKFVSVIRQFPQIWDRSHPQFRDKDAKDSAWDVVGSKMGCSGDSCKETFKSLREKYIREREKLQYGHSYREWDLLSDLKFLDPNILPRKQSTNNESDLQKAEEFQSQINLDSSFALVNHTNFDRALIGLVKKTTPIWDRNSNTYPNKQMKIQLWQSIAAKLNKDTNQCMLRWKALREKYIRQKTKFEQEGDVKWELLEDMNFLDKVIQYRKKHSEGDPDYKCKPYNDNRYNFQSSFLHQSELSLESENNYPQKLQHYETGDDNSLNDSSNDYPMTFKEEHATVLQVADSSYSHQPLRKRSTSVNSDAVVDKRPKCEETEATQRTPEQLFGDLVAAMLTKKPEKDRNLYMIEIMTVLSK